MLGFLVSLFFLVTGVYNLLETVRLRRMRQMLHSLVIATSCPVIDDWLEAGGDDRKTWFSLFCAAALVTSGVTGTYSITADGDVCQVFDETGKEVVAVHPIVEQQQQHDSDCRTESSSTAHPMSPSDWKL